jgi:hypothetical protein
MKALCKIGHSRKYILRKGYVRIIKGMIYEVVKMDRYHTYIETNGRIAGFLNFRFELLPDNVPKG